MAKNVQTPAKIVVETNIGRIKFRKTARGYKASCKGQPPIKIISVTDAGGRESFEPRVVMDPSQIIRMDAVKTAEKAFKMAARAYWA